jgi:hypothetical protein
MAALPADVPPPSDPSRSDRDTASALGRDLKRTILEAALRAAAVGPQPAKDAAEITRQVRLKLRR